MGDVGWVRSGKRPGMGPMNIVVKYWVLIKVSLESSVL